VLAYLQHINHAATVPLQDVQPRRSLLRVSLAPRVQRLKLCGQRVACLVAGLVAFAILLLPSLVVPPVGGRSGVKARKSKGGGGVNRTVCP
jgi:hypothetical protein